MMRTAGRRGGSPGEQQRRRREVRDWCVQVRVRNSSVPPASCVSGSFTFFNKKFLLKTKQDKHTSASAIQTQAIRHNNRNPVSYKLLIKNHWFFCGTLLLSFLLEMLITEDV